MPVESTYSVMKSALATRLGARPGLANVNVLAHIPVNADDIRTPAGTFETVYMGEADGTFADVILCAGGLRFDETLTLAVVVEVHGTDSVDGTQAAVDNRANELAYEVLADVADQQDWDFAALGLDVFDYLFFTPTAQRWSPGRLQQTGVFASRCELGIEIRARRSFT